MSTKVLYKTLLCVLFALPAVSWAVATDPIPPDTIIGVELDTTLYWTGSDQAMNYDVYFGQDWEMLDFLGNVAVEMYDPSILEPDTTYYWQIDEHLFSGSVDIGNVWSFTTVPEPATISLFVLGAILLRRKRRI